MIRGEEGTRVTLGVLRGPRDEPVEVTITRETITVATVESKMLDDSIGYIRVTNFTESTPGEFDRHYDMLLAKGMRALVLDLRNNPGGLLSACVKVAEHFVPEGPVVYVRDRDERRATLYSETPDAGHPLAVLVNEGTASAAEIVAAAVQDWQTGILVGTRTFGKTTVQRVINLGRYGGFRVTTGEYRAPTGRSLLVRPIEPDVVVEGPEEAGPPEATPFEPSRVLRRGMVGLDVLAAQERLGYLGYDAGPADGIFGPRTERAVRLFQAAEGFPASGRLSPDQQRALDEAFRRAGLKPAEGRPDRQLDAAVDALVKELGAD